MDFLDDETEVNEDGDVLVPSSQPIQSRRPRKKQRLNNGYRSVSEEEDEADSDDYDLPSNENQEVGLGIDESVQYKSKYEDFMHVPEYAETQKDTFVTQLTQPWSSPTRMRGPRWKKQATPPTPVSRPMTVDRAPPQHRSMAAPPPRPLPPRAAKPPSPPLVDEFDDDDPEPLEAFMSSPFESMQVQPNYQRPDQGGESHGPITTAATSMRQTTLFGMYTTQRDSRASQSTKTHNWPLANRSESPTHHAIDTEAMKTWVYPTNLGRIRDYQYNIVHKGLYHNLLVALPTGLGKTFIAATVMLNWFRWTKEAQIVFVAPTKPLVAQQIKACYDVAGIPKSTTTMMTGEVPAAMRVEDWKDKRVFFMTPQTLMNDLKSGIADPKKIVLLVVDEAHKATGNYAYVEVVRILRRFTESFRVLALTATPGSSVAKVQEVIDGLDIARVEIRTEDSIDIRQFVYSRDIRLQIFDNSEEVSMTLELFDGAVTPVLSQLTSQGAYWEKRPSNMVLFTMKNARDSWFRSEAAKLAGNGLKFKLNRIFQVLMSLAHNVELLKFHGIGPFYHKMKTFENEAGAGKYTQMIIENEYFKKMMNYMRNWVNNPDFEGHPKLTYLKEVVLNHFMDAGEGRGANSTRGPAETRIMVFAHYRDSAEEIQRVLKRHEPMIRPHCFVGQSGTKGSDGMNQRMQLDIIQKFKSGVYNTLVATSIGEEGLDIGEVDLIVCYDSSQSPIRMLQRMGRTGRKRAGNIEVLLMRGKEENNYHKAKDNYEKMQEIIENGTEFTFHDDRSARIVPKEIQPVVDKRVVEIPVENTQGPELPDPRKRKGKAKTIKNPPKQFHMPDGVETGFAFLGDGKSRKAKKAQETPALDDEIATLPQLETVLMSAQDEERFDKEYRQVSGTEPQYIQSVRFEAFPESQRELQMTFIVGHSRYSKAIVSAIKKMNDPFQSWELPTKEEIMQTQTPSLKTRAERPTKPKTKPAPPPKTSKPSKKANAVPTGTSETLRSSSAISADDYDGNDSFIDDDTPQQRKHQEQSPYTSPLKFNVPPRKAASEPKAPVEQPWYVSQKSAPEEDSEEELPDFDDIVGLTGATVVAKEKERTSAGRKKGPRRVVGSDDDE